MTDGGSLDPRWPAAVTLEELGELVAQWLEGRIIGVTPFYGGPPDPETTELIPVLASLNRSGFVTEHSQPGEVDGDSAQRAAVSGYCHRDVAERLASVSVRGDLIVISQWPGDEGDFELPITRDGDRTFTRQSGNPMVPWDEDSWPQRCFHPQLRAVLLDAWYLAACDPVWGA
jgi:hypothetical protein